jgi:hypothetical protein
MVINGVNMILLAAPNGVKKWCASKEKIVCMYPTRHRV